MKKKKKFKDRIYQLTLGIPRLCDWVIKYVHEKIMYIKEEKDINPIAIIEKIYEDNSKVRPEICMLKCADFPENAAQMYKSFVKASFHGIYINLLEKTIINNMNGLELIRYLNIYVQKERDGFGKVLFPELIIQALRYYGYIQDFITFYEEAGFMFNSDHIVEKMPAYFFLYKLATFAKCNFSDVFPSLNTKFLKSIKLPIGKIKHFRGPKLVKNPDKVTTLQRKDIGDAITELFNWMQDVNSSKQRVLLRNDWKKILKNYILPSLIHSGSNCYINYCPKSKSADTTVILLTPTVGETYQINQIEFQMKSNQPITFKLINDELAKLIIDDKDIYYTFIIISLNDPSETITTILKELEVTDITYTKYGEKILSLIFHAGISIKTVSPKHTYLVLPKNVECVLMYEEGLKHLLEQTSYDLLKIATSRTADLHRQKTADTINEGMDVPNTKRKLDTVVIASDDGDDEKGKKPKIDKENMY